MLAAKQSGVSSQAEEMSTTEPELESSLEKLIADINARVLISGNSLPTGIVLMKKVLTDLNRGVVAKTKQSGGTRSN